MSNDTAYLCMKWLNLREKAEIDKLIFSCILHFIFINFIIRFKTLNVGEVFVL